MPTQPVKKNHHYVPICYLKGYVDRDGRVFAYRKDKPEPPLHMLPSEIAFERYYYSQPIPEGGRNNSLEDFFSTIETTWPAVTDRMARREDVSSLIDDIAVFLTMMRVRVPAARDMAELSAAANIKATVRQLDAMGELPPKPVGAEDLLDHLVVPIDPTESLRAMGSMAEGFSKTFDRMGFEILHNETNISLISSDNPVVYFDPDTPEKQLRPYDAAPPKRIELLFPVNKRLVLRGHSDLFGKKYVRHRTLVRSDDVKRINKFVARFGYRFIFAADEHHAPLVKKYADWSPVLRSEAIPHKGGTLIWHRTIFGARRPKPKWSPRET